VFVVAVVAAGVVPPVLELVVDVALLLLPQAASSAPMTGALKPSASPRRNSARREMRPLSAWSNNSAMRAFRSMCLTPLQHNAPNPRHRCACAIPRPGHDTRARRARRLQVARGMRATLR
jgi:hypothetical protein